MSVIERCPYYRFVRKGRLDCNTGGDNSNKGCLGSPMNNVMSSRKFGRPSRNFSVAFSMFNV